ncbi:hypothetical protein U9M48_038781 [Paspalum notatum var. saurae]|uniref:Uncharacterized protein n=1 Tax=Paspalum notatum var. saurae TaxID=547442 RepID=A0AAQ3UM28_PASNO
MQLLLRAHFSLCQSSSPAGLSLRACSSEWFRPGSGFTATGRFGRGVVLILYDDDCCLPASPTSSLPPPEERASEAVVVQLDLDPYFGARYGRFLGQPWCCRLVQEVDLPTPEEERSISALAFQIWKLLCVLTDREDGENDLCQYNVGCEGLYVHTIENIGKMRGKKRVLKNEGAKPPCPPILDPPFAPMDLW